LNALTPLEIDAPAHPRGRLPFGFGSRFFLTLFFGLIWIVPAWWFPRFIAVMFLWDALACAV